MPHIEPLGRVRTKIVATIGPATRSPDMLARLIEAGVDIVRLNFSHGTHEDHTQVLRDIRRIGASLHREVGVLQDLGGPKIRLGAMEGDVVDCHEGEHFLLLSDVPEPTGPGVLTCTYDDLPNDLKVGETIFLADGSVAMRVLESAPGRAKLEVTLPGRIRSRQGINLPGTELKVSALTPKDLTDLDWTAPNQVDYVGLSFVRRPEDVVALRQELVKRGSRARIVAKIEKPQAVANLEAILEVTDAVMVARGDLGVEMDVAQIPAIQKRIIAACHKARVPVITATQMLASMESSNRPTRAEASDVFNAILDGTDAVMLSGETAVGDYPIDAVGTMSRIAQEAEGLLASRDMWAPPPPSPRSDWITPITESVVEAASMISRHLDAALIVVATSTGRTALALSQYRNPTPVLALAENEQITRWMALYWGVTPLHVTDRDNPEEVLEFVQQWARERGLIRSGDRVVLVRGSTIDSQVHNAVLVHQEP